MFGLDKEDSERLFNLSIFHVAMTDKEMEESMPAFLIVFGILAVIGLIWLVIANI